MPSANPPLRDAERCLPAGEHHGFLPAVAVPVVEGAGEDGLLCPQPRECRAAVGGACRLRVGRQASFARRLEQAKYLLETGQGGLPLRKRRVYLGGERLPAPRQVSPAASAMASASKRSLRRPLPTSKRSAAASMASNTGTP